MDKTEKMQPAQSLPPEAKEKAIGHLRASIITYLVCTLVFIAMAFGFISLSKDLALTAVFVMAVPCILFFLGIYAELVRINCLRENRFDWKESTVGEGMFVGRLRGGGRGATAYYKAPSIGGVAAVGINLSKLKSGDKVYDIEIYSKLPLGISSRFQLKK
jgi:hypothetical protein